MIGDIVTIIDFIFNRYDKVKEANRQTFDSFVEPIYLKFTTIHEYYLRIFLEFRREIELAHPLKLQVVINKIEKERLFSVDIRTEIIQSLKIDNSQIESFTKSVLYYLITPQALVYESFSARSSLILMLKAIDKISLSDLLLYEDAKKILDSIQENKIPVPNSAFWSSFVFVDIEPENRLRKLINNLETLEKNFDEFKRWQCLVEIDRRVKEFQDRYKRVVEEYWNLKRKLQ